MTVLDAQRRRARAQRVGWSFGGALRGVAALFRRSLAFVGDAFGAAHGPQAAVSDPGPAVSSLVADRQLRSAFLEASAQDLEWREQMIALVGPAVLARAAQAPKPSVADAQALDEQPAEEPAVQRKVG